MPKVNDDEYVMLKDATCMVQDISKSVHMYFNLIQWKLSIANTLTWGQLRSSVLVGVD